MSQSNLAYKSEEFTDTDYLKLERDSKTKHEFLNGKIIAMAGASDSHNVITSNIYGETYIQLKNSNCRPFSSDMRVKAYTGNYFYPDIVITCGDRVYEDDNKDVLLNPLVIFEVLSTSTKLKDRNEKFDSYLLLENLTDYILVEQDVMRLEHYSKKEDGEWRYRILSKEDDEVILDSTNCKITLKEIYDEIEFVEE